MALNSIFIPSEQPINQNSDSQISMGLMNSILDSSRDSQERWMKQVSKILEKDQVKVDIHHGVSIFRVPTALSSPKPEAYKPQLMGLGPYHRFRPELYEMERYKLAAAIRVRRKHYQNLEFKEFVDQLNETEDEIRACYHKYLGFDGDTLLWFMVIDGLFLLEFLHSYSYINKNDSRSSLSRTAHLVDSGGNKLAHNHNAILLGDIMMLENQIPIFLLCKILFLVIQSSKSESDIDDNWLPSMLMGFCKVVSPLKLVKEDLPLSEVSEHAHLLDLLYHLTVPKTKKVPHGACVVNVPTELSATPMENSGNNYEVLCSIIMKLSSKLNIRWVRKIIRPINMTVKGLPKVFRLESNIEDNIKPECEGSNEDLHNPRVKEIMIPSVSSLCDAGVEFCPSHSDITTIKFDNKKKKFYLPVLTLNVSSEVIIRNLVAYEASIVSESLVLGRYTELMNGIIDTVEDAKLLREKKIIVNNLKTDAEVAQIFNGMSKSIRLSNVPHIDMAINDVNKYYYSTRKVKVYMCIKKYVYGSWQLVTLLTTVLLMLLMVVQSFCSIIVALPFLRRAIYKWDMSWVDDFFYRSLLNDAHDQ